MDVLPSVDAVDIENGVRMLPSVVVMDPEAVEGKAVRIVVISASQLQQMPQKPLQLGLGHRPRIDGCFLSFLFRFQIKLHSIRSILPDQR